MICIDTSLVVRALTGEPGYEKAGRLFSSWLEANEFLIAPILLNYEVISAFCRKSFMNEMKDEEVIQAYQAFQELGISTYHDPKWNEKALLLARSFHQKTPYDFIYLVCAEELEAELYTVDFQFYKLVGESYTFVKYFGE